MMEEASEAMISSNQATINFEFRFDREFDEHQNKLQRYQSLVQKSKESLIGNVDLEVVKIQIYPVARAGKSGSEVFYMDLFVKGIEYPKRFIAKFQSLEKTNDEFKGAERARFAGLCATVEKAVDEDEKIGLIVYDLAMLNKHIEFRGYFLDVNNKDEHCVEALDSAFSRVGLLSNGAETSKLFIEDFSDYIDRSRRPLERLESYQKYDGEEPQLSSLAKNVLSYYEKISTLVSEIKVFPYLVHGDLHARNLMLSSDRPCQTELIDFDWVHYGHPAKDFCLMEVTLKYMLLYELQLSYRKEKEIIHIPIKAIELMEDYLCENVFELSSVEMFFDFIEEECTLSSLNKSVMARVYKCLQVVRREAKRVLDEYVQKEVESGKRESAEKHYLISNFLIALGLSAMDEVETLWVLTSLNIVGRAICLTPD